MPFPFIFALKYFQAAFVYLDVWVKLWHWNELEKKSMPLCIFIYSFILFLVREIAEFFALPDVSSAFI